jgi:hypothetical protein
MAEYTHPPARDAYVAPCYPADPFPFTRETMSIGFRMKTIKEIRAELAKMSDTQLIEHGKTLRGFCRRIPGQKIDKGWLMQLNEARAEWMRRHPLKTLRERK